MRQNLIKSSLTVFLTWWVISFAWGFYNDGYQVFENIEYSLIILIACCVGLVLGFLSVILFVRVNKQAKIEMLASDNLRGLICTLGSVPFIAKEPKMSEKHLSFDAAGKVCVDVPDSFFNEWAEKYKVDYPNHVKLMQELLDVFNYDADLPATHVAGGHGDRSLLQHSLLAAYQMDLLGKSWSYKGLFSKNKKHVVLGLKNNDYKFNPDDPLCAIIGLAHDLGKVEAYIKDSVGKVIGIRSEHDLTGARMLARMATIWELPESDRRAITLSIAHYHHPMALPLSPDRKAVDDRTIAIMELLIQTDTVVSAIEAQKYGVVDSRVATSGEEPDSPTIADLQAEDIWIHLISCINEVGRINSSSKQHNIGCYCDVKGFNKPMLLLRDDQLRSIMMQKLGIRYAEMLPGGVYEVNARLRAILDQKGVLVKTLKGVSYNSDYAIWNLSFYARTAKGVDPKQTSQWSSVNIIDVSKIPEINNLSTYYWIGVVDGGVFGQGRALKKNAPKESQEYEGEIPAVSSAIADADAPTAEEIEAMRAMGVDVSQYQAQPTDATTVETEHPSLEVSGHVEATSQLPDAHPASSEAPGPGGQFVAGEQPQQNGVKNEPGSLVVETRLEDDFAPGVVSDLLDDLINGMQYSKPNDQQETAAAPHSDAINSEKLNDPDIDKAESNADLPDVTRLPPESKNIQDALVSKKRQDEITTHEKQTSNEGIGARSQLDENHKDVGQDNSVTEEQSDSKSKNLAMKRRYPAGDIYSIIVSVFKSQLPAFGGSVKEHPEHGYLLSIATLIKTNPEIPWIELKDVLQDYAERRKISCKILENKIKPDFYVIAVPRILIDD